MRPDRAASSRTGVDTLTGKGPAKALEGPSVVVDVSNSPSFEAAAVLEFFEFGPAAASLAATRFEDRLHRSEPSG